MLTPNCTVVSLYVTLPVSTHHAGDSNDSRADSSKVGHHITHNTLMSWNTLSCWGNLTVITYNRTSMIMFSD